MQVQSIPSGKCPLRAYAFPFLHCSIRHSASSCTTASKLTSRPTDNRAYVSLWARAFATRNNSRNPKIGRSPDGMEPAMRKCVCRRVFLAITSECCSCYEGSTYCKLFCHSYMFSLYHWLASAVRVIQCSARSTRIRQSLCKRGRHAAKVPQD